MKLKELKEFFESQGLEFKLETIDGIEMLVNTDEKILIGIKRDAIQCVERSTEISDIGEYIAAANEKFNLDSTNYPAFIGQMKGDTKKNFAKYLK